MGRRILSLLISAILAATMLPTSAFASGEYMLTLATSDSTCDSFCSVYVDGVSQGSITSETTLSVPAGATVKVQGNPSGDTLLEGWEVEPEGAVEVADNRIITFTMPEQNITLTRLVSHLDPHASFDENGVLTWDAVEGYSCALHVGLGDAESGPLKVTDLVADGGRYTYDVQTALQELEWSGKQLGTGDYKANLYYYKGGQQYDNGRAMLVDVASYHYTAGNKITLDTPANLHWDGYVATWDAVENAASYRVDVKCHLPTWTPNLQYSVDTPYMALSQVNVGYLQDGATFEFSVTAIPENSYKYAESAQSAYSDLVTYRTSADAPTISTHPQSASYTSGDAAEPLSVEAAVADEGTLSFQWYSNTSESTSDGTPINGENESTYTPSTDTAGTTWYYCVVTNTLNGMTAQTTSNAAKIEVAPAIIPYGVTVEGIAVTSENADDVLGDGAVGYVAGSNELVLTDASIDAVNGWAISADGDLSIRLSGTSTCDGAIQVHGNLTVIGTGSTGGASGFESYESSLTVRTTENNHPCIASEGSIDVRDAALRLTAEDPYTQAMRGGKEKTISLQRSYVSATGPNSGISCDNGMVLIKDSTVIAEGRYGISANYQGSIEIVDSSVTMNGTDACGAYAKALTVEGSDVSVSTDSYDYGLWILDTLTIQGSDFTCQSPTRGIMAGNIIVDDSSASDASEVTVQCDSGYCIVLYPSSGQFKVTPKSGVSMDAFTGSNQDGSDASRVEGAPFDTEQVLNGTYTGRYFQLKTHEHEAIQGPDGATWSSNESSHWNTCVCEAQLNKAAHTFEWVTDREATAATAGSKHEECTVCGYAKNPVEIPATGAKEQTPQAEFIATSDSGGTLSNVEVGMRYSVDGGATWLDVTGDGITIEGVTAEGDVKVYQPGDGTDKLDSDIQTIDVTQAATPTGVKGVPCTTSAQNDGQITGADATMEYRLSSNSTWTAIAGDTLTGLSSGAYEVRVKANGTALASPAVAVAIDAHACAGQGEWHHDESEHWQRCACGERIEAAPHTFEWVIDEDATETAAGSKHEECTVCGYAKAAVEIPATGTEEKPDGSEEKPAGSDEKPSDSNKPGATPADPSATTRTSADGEQATGRKIPRTGDGGDVLPMAATMAAIGATLIAIAIRTRRDASKG